MTRTYSIALAANDPDNGNEIGQVRAIDICDGLLESDDRLFHRPLRLVELDGAIRLSGKVWPVLASAAWVGNWCWNEYRVTLETLLEFLRWLRDRKLFWSWSGEEVFCDWMGRPGTGTYDGLTDEGLGDRINTWVSAQ